MTGKRHSKLFKAICAAAPFSGALAGALLLGPHVAKANTSFVYNPASSSTDSWSLGTNWSSVPVNAIDTALVFGTPTTSFGISQANTSVNDIAANFQLNELDLQGNGTNLGVSTGFANAITVTGSSMTLVNNGSTDPIISLTAAPNTATLFYNVLNNLTIGNNVTISGGGAATFNFAGGVSGSGALIKTGNSTAAFEGNLSIGSSVSVTGGTLVLTGANTYSGTTSVTGGTLRAGKVVSLPGLNTPGSIVVGGGTLDLQVGQLAGEFGAADIDTARSNVTFNGNAFLGINVDPSTTFTYASNIANSLTLVKTGNGTLSLTGNNTHVATQVSAGRLLIGSAAGLGSGTFILNGGTIDNTTGAPLTLANSISWSGNFTYEGSANDLTLGPVNSSGARVITVKGHTVTMGTLVNSSTAALTKLGAGTLVLSGAGNVYSNTIMNGGVLDLSSAGNLGTGSVAIGLGEIRATGTSAGPRAITAGTLSFAAVAGGSLGGGGGITLIADPTQPITFTASNLGPRGIYTTQLLRGTNLGTAASGPGVANIFFSTDPSVNTGTSATNGFAAIGPGNVNTTQAAVLRGALIATTASGTGSGFATYEKNGVNGGTADVGVRALNLSEQQTTYPSANTTDNVRVNLAAGSTGFAGFSENTLQLDATAGPATASFTSGALAPVNGLLFSGTQAITLSTSGTGTFNVGAGASTPFDVMILSTNTAGVTINSGMNNGGGAERGYTFAGPGNITVNGNLIGVSGTGGFAINGPSTVTLNGSMATSSKGFVVNGGELKLGASFSQTSQRPIQVAGGATLETNGVNVANIDFLGDVGGTGGTITNSSATTSTLTVIHQSSNTARNTFSGAITGNINLTINATSTLVVPGTQALAGKNTYTGNTTINSGTLLLGINDSLPTSTPLIINNGALPSLFDLSGYNQTVGSVAGTGGTIGNNLLNTRSILTVGGSTSTTWGGVIADNTNPNGIGGQVSLVRSGSGTLNLSGTHTFSGGTTINSGALRVNGSFASASNGVTVNSTGILGGTGAIAGPVAVNSGGHLAPGASVGTLTVNNTLALSSGSVLDYEFNGASNDLLDASAASNAFTLNGGAFNLFQENSTNLYDTPGTYNLIKFSGAIQGLGLDSTWTTASPSNPHVLNPNSFSRSYQFGTNSGFLTLTINSTLVAATWNDSASDKSWANGSNWTSTPTNNTVPNAAGASAAFNGAGSPETINLNGNKTVGALTLNSGNSYTIAQGSGGNLIIDNSTFLGAITDTNGTHTISAPVTLNSNTTVTVANSTDTLTLSQSIGGTASLTKAGSGTLVLGGNNTHAGTTINNGTVVISSDTNLGAAASPVVINTGALSTGTSMSSARTVRLGSTSSTIDVSGAATYELDGSITDGSAAGSLTKTGDGTLLINTTASNTGGTNVVAGVLQIGNGGSTGAISTGSVANNATLLVNRTGTTAIAGAMSGTGSLIQTGGGTLTLSGNNSNYAGSISVTGSTLNLASTNNLGAGFILLDTATLTQSVGATIYNGAIAAPFGSVTVVGATTVDVGANNLTISSQIGGSGTITKLGSGTLTIGIVNNTAINNAAFTGTLSSSVGAVSFVGRNSGSAQGHFIFNGGSVSIGNAGGTFNLGFLQGSAPITASSGQTRIRVGDAGLDSAYSGNFIGGTAGLAKFGADTLTLSGQNTFIGADAITLSGFVGYNVAVGAGTLVAGSSTTGIVTGPFGAGPDNSSVGFFSGAVVLIGGGNNITSAALMTGGAVQVDNNITASGSGDVTATTPYTLRLGGNTDNTSTFTGKIQLQNNLTVSQVATTGNHALNITGSIFGTGALTGPNPSLAGTENTGFQTVTFAGAGSINVSGLISDADITGAVPGGGQVAVASTGGRATLTGTNTYSGPTTIAGGTLVLGNNAQSPVLTGSGGAIVNSGLLILDYNGGSTPLDTVKSDIQSGQIKSTNVADPNFAIGYHDITATKQLLVRYTYRGDANCDGLVNALDFNALATHFGNAPGLNWDQGDFNGDGLVTTQDFTFLATNFNAVPAPATVLGTLVPEPAVLPILAASIIAVRRRRRERSSREVR